ncbi:hypothetical protein TrVE_jg13915 [Triparma verrucosa]|uniref:Uncharacterized protein n=1 Tax=Triparma verrucosa TaxID=1606542 RepID=A0A9W7B5H1_9STRA|nr:hypothetical protein TrVE_jg13915 [Triparma verrucosa]
MFCYKFVLAFALLCTTMHQANSFMPHVPKSLQIQHSSLTESRRHRLPFVPSSPLLSRPTALKSVHHTASVVIADLTRAAGIGLVGVLGSYVSQTVLREEAQGYDAVDDFEDFDDDEYDEGDYDYDYDDYSDDGDEVDRAPRAGRRRRSSSPPQ